MVLPFYQVEGILLPISEIEYGSAFRLCPPPFGDIYYRGRALDGFYRCYYVRDFQFRSTLIHSDAIVYTL